MLTTHPLRYLSRAGFLAALLFVFSGYAARAQDWPQWRGPDRSGICSDKVALADNWPAAGPKRLWQSETIPGAERGGYGSPVVAGNRVYLYANVKYAVPIATCTVPEDKLRNLGWVAADKLPPADLLKTVEDARLSDQRDKITGYQATVAWTDQWLKDHLTPEQNKAFGAYCNDRLRRGKGAFAPDDLTKLTPIKDKAFPSPKDFEAWLDQNGITGDLRQAAVKAEVTTQDIGKDVIYCLDDADGKTLWHKEYDKIQSVKADVFHASSSTPCIAAGKCYVAGADGALYCLNASDGTELWVSHVGSALQNSSPLVVDDLVIVAAAPTYAVHIADGKVAWQQPKAVAHSNSPVVWESGGKKYLLCNSEDKLRCLDAATGEILWDIPGKLFSTAAVAGDVMAVQSGDKTTGLSAYHLSPAKADKLWTVDTTDRGASPIIYDGCVYSVASGRAVCVRLADGTIAGDHKLGGGEISSPVLADGKLFAMADSGKNFFMLRCNPEKFDQLAKAVMGILTCSSPAIAHGRLYIRQDKGVACYDLAAPTQP